jgi:hypothetical protein
MCVPVTLPQPLTCAGDARLDARHISSGAAGPGRMAMVSGILAVRLLQMEIGASFLLEPNYTRRW